MRASILSVLIILSFASQSRAELGCYGGLKLGKTEKVGRLTPVGSDDVDKLSGYQAMGEKGGYTFRAEIFGDDVILKIQPDGERPVLKERVKRDLAHASVKVAGDMSAYIFCNQE